MNELSTLRLTTISWTFKLLRIISLRKTKNLWYEKVWIGGPRIKECFRGQDFRNNGYLLGRVFECTVSSIWHHFCNIYLLKKRNQIDGSVKLNFAFYRGLPNTYFIQTNTSLHFKITKLLTQEHEPYCI